MVRRAANVATPAQVAQILVHLHPARDEARLFACLDGGYEQFFDRHAEFVVQLLRVTVRPTVCL